MKIEEESPSTDISGLVGQQLNLNTIVRILKHSASYRTESSMRFDMLSKSLRTHHVDMLPVPD